MLFTTRAALSQPQEYTHEILALPNTPYKASNPYPFHSTGSLPRFVTPQKRSPTDRSNTPCGGISVSVVHEGDHRPRGSLDGEASILHSYVGREALKYRVDGDTSMFQSKTSLSAPAGEEAKRPISLDVKRLSQQKRLSGAGSRPATSDSSEGSP